MEFEGWMSSFTRLSPKSINSYAAAIDGRLTNWAIINGIINGPIRRITSPLEFSTLAAEISRTREFIEHNERGRSMYSSALKHYADFLVNQTENGARNVDLQGPHSTKIFALETAPQASPFVPTDHEDARQKILREVVSRRGQGKFRAGLIEAYQAKCAITGCSVLPILEAAHITPYLGPETNALSNGILLRADIHTLWDLGFIALSPWDKCVWVSPKITDTVYQALSGAIAFQPNEPSSCPSIHALRQQWESAEAEIKC